MMPVSPDVRSDPMQKFIVDNNEKPTVLSALRQNLPNNPSWSNVRKLMRNRFVSIGGVLCMDEARRLSPGEIVTVSDRALAPPPGDKNVNVLFVDQQIVVVEKPHGMLTLRRKSEYSWSWEKRNLQPTLDECVPRILGEHAAKKKNENRVQRKHPKLYPIHRLDRDSSGVMVFARNKEAQTNIILQFAQHSAVRKYLALIPGKIDDQTIQSQLIRDRGDGLRGSTEDTTIGEHAITHFLTQRMIGNYSEVECRLETGRTNQIRIHLAESDHPICGDIKYRGPVGQPGIVDESGIHRLALHAAELRFQHPVTSELVTFATHWPIDMLRYIERISG